MNRKKNGYQNLPGSAGGVQEKKKYNWKDHVVWVKYLFREVFIIVEFAKNIEFF
jgi:hypothetical protein